MLRIGLTGGIGAGKSTVAGLLADRGAEIIDADAIAREVVAPGEPLLDVLAEAFGDDIIAADGGLDRAALAAVAFADPESTSRLGALMHPVIRDRTAERFAASTAEVVVHDVPLLVENHMEVGYHLSLLVDVPAEVRLERLVATRGMDRTDAETRIARQADDAQRRAACDVIVANTGTVDATAVLVDRLWTDRLAPFAANLAAARPARREAEATRAEAGDAGSHLGGRRDGDVERLIAKLRHGTGEEFPITSVDGSPTGPIRLEISVPDASTAETLSPRLSALGFPPVAEGAAATGPDGGPESTADVGADTGAISRHANADPGLPVDLEVRIGT